MTWLNVVTGKPMQRQQTIVAAPIARGRRFAKRGDRVTCEEGHYICVAARDLYVGDMQDGREDWADWCFDAPPIPGTLPPPCQCGAVWWKPLRDEDIVGFHFEEGWR